MPDILVHVDFKGLPLAPAELCKLLETVSEGGATGVIFEWEDMLPFDGSLRALRAPHAYTAAEVTRVVGTAKELGLEVVPLVQTLGHLEYALKSEEYAELREDPADFGTICPTSAAAQAFLKDLLEQVVALHPNSSRVHIGCDEPTLAPSTAASHADGVAGIVADHVCRTAALLKTIRGDGQNAVGCMMWHDACVGMSDAALHALLSAPVRIVCWDYRPAFEPTAASLAFAERVLAKGEAPYFGSAFKGAEQCDSVMPDYAARLANQHAWRQWLARQHSVLITKRYSRIMLQSPYGAMWGVVLTGWSRFGHTMPLTEPMSAGMAALVAALGVWKRCNKDGAEAEVDAAPPPDDDWQAIDAAPPADPFTKLCEDVSAARAAVDALETEWRLNTAPATARAPAPKLRARVLVEARALVAALDVADNQLARVRASGRLRGSADIDEWRAAKIREPRERAASIVRAASAGGDGAAATEGLVARLVSTPPTGQQLVGAGIVMGALVLVALRR